MTEVSAGTLTDFLLARIAEDEFAARAAGSAPWQWEQGYGQMCNDAECPYGQLMQVKPDVGLALLMEVHGYDVRADAWDGAEQIARWHPARVLAECEMKRWLVATFQPPNYERYRDPEIMRRLALPYADHPDYREEWRP